MVRKVREESQKKVGRRGREREIEGGRETEGEGRELRGKKELDKRGWEERKGG